MHEHVSTAQPGTQSVWNTACPDGKEVPKCAKLRNSAMFAVGVTGERRRVERCDLGERVDPGERVLAVVDAAVVAVLFPHETGAVVRDRAVAVIREARRQTRLQLAVLPGAGARDHRPKGVVTHHLPGAEALAARLREADGEISGAARQRAFAGDRGGKRAGLLSDERLHRPLVADSPAHLPALGLDRRPLARTASHFANSGELFFFAALASAASRQAPYWPAALSFAASHFSPAVAPSVADAQATATSVIQSIAHSCRSLVLVTSPRSNFDRPARVTRSRKFPWMGISIDSRSSRLRPRQ